MKRISCALLVFGLAPFSAAADPFEQLVANGWVWNPAMAVNCEEGETYSVSKDRTRIWVETGEVMEVRGTKTRRAEYDVLGYGPTHIDMFLKLEKWRGDDGNLVWWRLRFLADGRFVWIRSDWETGRSTKPMTPCKVIG